MKVHHMRNGSDFPQYDNDGAWVKYWGLQDVSLEKCLAAIPEHVKRYVETVYWHEKAKTLRVPVYKEWRVPKEAKAEE